MERSIGVHVGKLIPRKNGRLKEDFVGGRHNW
jgi:hypothetical protein